MAGIHDSRSHFQFSWQSRSRFGHCDPDMNDSNCFCHLRKPDRCLLAIPTCNWLIARLLPNELPLFFGTPRSTFPLLPLRHLRRRPLQWWWCRRPPPHLHWKFHRFPTPGWQFKWLDGAQKINTGKGASFPNFTKVSREVQLIPWWPWYSATNFHWL